MIMTGSEPAALGGAGTVDPNPKMPVNLKGMSLMNVAHRPEKGLAHKADADGPGRERIAHKA